MGFLLIVTMLDYCHLILLFLLIGFNVFVLQVIRVFQLGLSIKVKHVTVIPILIDVDLVYIHVFFVDYLDFVLCGERDGNREGKRVWVIARERTERWREERIDKLRDGQRKKELQR